MANLIAFAALPGAKASSTPVQGIISEQWQAVLDGITTDPFKDIINSHLGQILLSPHRTYPDLFLTKIDPTMPDTSVPNRYVVDLQWSNKVPFEDGVSLDGKLFKYEPNPYQESAKINRTFYTTSIKMDTDLDDLPVTTTAGEQIFHMEEVQYRCWQIQKKVPKMPDVFNKQYPNGSNIFINSDSVLMDGITYDKYELQVRDINLGVPELKNKYLFFNLSYVMMYNPEGWLTKKRNAGFIANQWFRVPDPQNPGPVAFRFKTIQRPAPIKIGEPPQFPPNPVPLSTDGTVYPGFAAQSVDANGLPQISGINDQNDAKFLKEVEKNTRLTFRFKNAIKFTNNVPLK